MLEKNITKEKSSGALKTSRRRAVTLKALENKGKYEAVFEFAGDIILLIDGMGTIMDVNKKLTEISGYRRQEFVGKNIRMLAPMMTAKSKAKIIRNFQKRVAGVPISPYEVELFKKTGELFTFEVNAQPLTKIGKIIGDLVILRDVTERKRMEESLKEAEANYRDFLDNSSMGIRVREGANHILYINQAYLDIFGFESVEEAKLTSPVEHYTPESFAEYLLRNEKLSRGEPVPDKIEVDIVRKDGAIRHVQVLGKSVIRNGKGQGQTFYNDITAIKQAEAIVKNSEQNLHNALDKLPMGFRITDIDDNTLYLNQAFLDIFGYENADEVSRKPPLKDFYTPESYAGYLRRKQKLLHGEPRQQGVEVEIIRKDGMLRHLQLFTGELFWNGKKQFQTLYADITAQRNTEMALIKSEQNFRNSLDSSFMGIYIVDTDWHILYVNQAFLDLFGYKNIAEVRTNPPHENYTKESYADYLQRNERLARGEPNPDKFGLDIVRKDGAIRHLQVFRKEVFWDGQQQSQLLYNDITEQRQAEEALKASEEHFRRLTENSPDMITRFSFVPAGHFEYVSPVSRVITGYTPEEYYANPELNAIIVHPEDKGLRQSMMDKPELYEGIPVQMRYIRKDGRTIWVERRQVSNS